MAPSIGCLFTTPVRALAQRSENDSCHGWDCLGEAAQFGIILVIFAFVVALGYLYWRFQIKRAYPIGRNGRHSEDSYEVEITGQTSDTVSVTIYPVQRPPEPHGDDERRRLQQRRRNVKDAGTQHEESMVPAPVQIEDLRPPEIHLVPPPPPPPALWAAAYPVVTPPSGFGPPFLSTAQPPPGLVHQEALRDSPPAVLYPQYAPPPYATAYPHTPEPGRNPPMPPACTPQPAVWSHTPGDGRGVPAQGAFHGDSQPRRRRWFSMNAFLPRVGHARTLSDSGTVASLPSRPASQHSVAPHNPERGRNHLRHTSGRRSSSSTSYASSSEYTSVQWQRSCSSDLPRNSQDDLQYHAGTAISPVNTSTEAVYGGQGSRDGGGSGLETRATPSHSVPLSDLPQPRLRSHNPRPRASADRRRPGPERNPVPDGGFTPRRRNTDTRGRSSSHRSRADGYGHTGTCRRRSYTTSDDAQRGIPGRLVRSFRRLRQALREDD